VMSNAGSALMGIGSSRGEDRAVAAAEMAVSSPLLEASIDGAHGVLLSIAGGSDLGLFEINEAAALVSQAAHAEANIIFGTVIDDALGDEVRVTVIAAGFDGGEPNAKQPVEARRTNFVPAAVGAAVGGAAVGGSSLGGSSLGGEAADVIGEIDIDELVETANWGEAPTAAADQIVSDPAFEDDGDDLDIPDFLK